MSQQIASELPSGSGFVIPVLFHGEKRIEKIGSSIIGQTVRSVEVLDDALEVMRITFENGAVMCIKPKQDIGSFKGSENVWIVGEE